MDRTDLTSSFLGRGWSFPVRAEAGQCATAAYDEDVRQAILIILGTTPGERVMRPEFGAGLNAYVFEPLNPATLEGLRQRALESLIDWEPRIDVERIDAHADLASTGKVVIEISYRIRATNAHANLVYPFYLEEGSAP